MFEIIARLSPISGDTFLLSVLLALALFIALPIGATFYVKHERRRRRKLVNSPRKIQLAEEEEIHASCDHRRSRSRARETADGGMVSICKKCGVDMRRNGRGDWSVVQKA